MSTQLHISRHRPGLGFALVLLLACAGLANAQWDNFTSPPGVNLSTCLLLTNGDVMCHEYGTNTWHRLRPNNVGSYKDGTWDSPAIAPMPNGSDNTNVGNGTCTPCVYAPLYFASAVLPDGRVVVIGGEYNTNSTSTMPVETNIGFVYDPATDSWSSQLTEPFGAGNMGDIQSTVLQNGTMLIADRVSGAVTGNVAAYDGNLTFNALNPPGKADINSEEGWNILPNGKVLAVDARSNNQSELYDPVANSWGNRVPTAGVILADFNDAIASSNCNSREVGPGIIRPDGTLVYFTAYITGQNAIYNVATNSWTAGPTFPDLGNGVLAMPDAPASLMPNGKVLAMASPGCKDIAAPMNPPNFSIFNKPSSFFEWNADNTLTQVTDADNAASYKAFQGRMLLLPTGEVLLTAWDQNSTRTLQLYTAGKTVGDDAWRPVIDSLPNILGAGVTYQATGHQFNGFSEGATYGDDAQSSSNYPLVRITNTGTGHVFYAKTHNHSRMGVVTQPSAESVSTSFDVPGGIELGASTLVVVTNGIPSQPYPVTLEPATTLTFTANNHTTSDFNDPVTVEARLTTKVGGLPIASKNVTFKLAGGGGTAECTDATDASGVATCSITPTQAAGNYPLIATFTSDSEFAGSSVEVNFVVTKEETELAFTAASATTEDYHDPATVEALLTSDGIPLANHTVNFKLGAGGGTAECSAMSGVDGKASCIITPNQAAGPYALHADFVTDAYYLASSASTNFIVTLEETTTKFNADSPTVIPVGHSATLKATLKEDGLVAISGRTLHLTLGTGPGAQSCDGVTNASGIGSCIIPNVTQPLGPNTVKAEFVGDAFYLPSSDTENVILFAFLDQGSMLLGNLSATLNSNVTFWSSQWTKVNSLSGGTAPNQENGFTGVAPQVCGGGWTSTPSNSPNPPATVPSYMGVIVSSSITKAGNNLIGNVGSIVVVKTNAGYGPAPGHPGTGTVVAVYCP